VRTKELDGSDLDITPSPRVDRAHKAVDQKSPLFFVSPFNGHNEPHYGRLSSTQLQYMTQVLPTTAGQDYELSFWLRRPLNALSPFVVRWEGQVAFGQTVLLPNDTDWFRFTVLLHSNINGSFIEFGQMSFPGEFHIDDISVVPVPAPSAAPLLLIGAAAAMRRRRRH